MKYIHLSDNARLDVGDKMAKVHPLLSMKNESFLRYYAFMKQQNLSTDEAMIPHFDKHIAKQFIRGKPIRFGYKMWVLTTPLGYVLQFEAYEGARGRQTEYPRLISELQEETGNSYHLTFDNLLTSYNLVDGLTSKGIARIGTLHSNRLGDAPLKSVKEMETHRREDFLLRN